MPRGQADRLEGQVAGCCCKKKKMAWSRHNGAFAVAAGLNVDNTWFVARDARCYMLIKKVGVLGTNSCTILLFFSLLQCPPQASTRASHFSTAWGAPTCVAATIAQSALALLLIALTGGSTTEPTQTCIIRKAYEKSETSKPIIFPSSV